MLERRLIAHMIRKERGTRPADGGHHQVCGRRLPFRDLHPPNRRLGA